MREKAIRLFVLAMGWRFGFCKDIRAVLFDALWWRMVEDLLG